MDAARDAVLHWLAYSFEEMATEEQLARGAGNHQRAEFFHRYGLIALRARQAEESDPEPKGPCLCSVCIDAYARGLA